MEQKPEKNNLMSREERINKLNLTPENRKKLDGVIAKVDKYKLEAEAMKNQFLEIEETFKFLDEDAEVISFAMIYAFARKMCIKEGLTENLEELVEILAGREIFSFAEEKIEGAEKAPNQEMLEKAHNELLEQKEYFLETLDELNDKIINSVIPFTEKLLFFGVNVKEILDILRAEEDGFYSIKTLNSLNNCLKYKDDLINKIKSVSDDEFINNFKNYRNLIMSFKESVINFLFTIKEPDWLPEISLLFALEDAKRKEGFTEDLSEKIKPLLEHFGYEQIYPKKGEEYDPRAHKPEGEEISIVKRGQVVRVVRRGLKKGDKVLIMAKVILAK